MSFTFIFGMFGIEYCVFIIYSGVLNFLDFVDQLRLTRKSNVQQNINFLSEWNMPQFSKPEIQVYRIHIVLNPSKI